MRTTLLLLLLVAASCAEPAAPAPEDPSAAPGLVAWRADEGAAFAAARTSGKPVLLFQMFGRLDQEFC